MIHWVHCNFQFTDDKNQRNTFLTLARTYLHQLARAIVIYKKLAEKKKILGVPNCNSSDVIRQVNLLFADGLLEFGASSLTDLNDEDISMAWRWDLTPER